MPKTGPGGVGYILYLAEMAPVLRPIDPFIVSIIGIVPNATILSKSELS